MRARREACHVRCLTEAEDAALFGQLQRRRAIGVAAQHIAALVNQGAGRIGLSRWVRPGIHPHHAHLHGRVHRPGTAHDGIDGTDHLRHREGGNIADGLGTRLARGDHALDVAAFVEASIVDRHIRQRCRAGRVFKEYARVLRRHALRGGEIGKAGGEDQPMAGADKLCHHAVEIGRRHGFDGGGVDAITQYLGHAAAALVVHMGPAEIADGADQDHANTQA